MIKNWFQKQYPFLVVIAAPIILFIEPILTGKAIFWGTPILQFIPWQVTAFEQLKAGTFPLWNPLNGMGAPLFANYQLALLYPPNLIMFLFYIVGGAASLAWGQTLSIAIHLAWAGCGMVILIRRLGFGKPAQTVSGLAFALCSSLVARSSFFTMIWAISWMPWILYAATFIVNQRGVFPSISIKPNLGKLGLLVIFITMQMFSGHAQMTWYTLILVTIWVFVDGLVTHNFKTGIFAVLVLIGCIVIAAMLSSVQLLPTLEYLTQSQRASAVGAETAMTYSFWPWRFLTLLSPGMFGSPAQGNYWGYANYWEDALYFGVLPLVLVLLTLPIVFRKRNKNPNRYRPIVAFSWISIVICFLLGLGKNFYLFPFLYKYIPTFDMFQAPARFLILAEFLFCVLAGIGLEQLKPLQGKTLYWTRLGTMGAAAITIGAWIALLAIPSINSTLIRGFAGFGAFTVGTGLLILFQPKIYYRRFIWISLLIGFISLDLILAHWNFNPTIQTSFFPTAKSTNSEINVGRTYLSASDEYAIKYKWFFRFDTFASTYDWNEIFKINLSNTNLLSKSAMVNNFDPIVPESYSSLMTLLNSASQIELGNWLALMNVSNRQIIKHDRLITIDTSSHNPQLVRFFTCEINAASHEEALILTKDLMKQSDGYFNTIILENSSSRMGCDNNGVEQFNFVIEKSSPSSLYLDVNTIKDGYLFIANTWFPGWHALVDGKETKLVRADYNFQAIPLQKGDHRIVVFYRSDSFLFGCAISMTTIGLLLLVVIITLIKKKKNPAKIN